MALILANYIMAHSVKVSLMPIMSKNQNHVDDEVAVEQDLERQAIFAAIGLSHSALNLLTDTQNGRRGR